MRPSQEDIRWLRLISVDPRAAVPDFSKSRLVAMSLVERRSEMLQVTEKGQALLKQAG